MATIPYKVRVTTEHQALPSARTGDTIACSFNSGPNPGNGVISAYTGTNLALTANMTDSNGTVMKKSQIGPSPTMRLQYDTKPPYDPFKVALEPRTDYTFNVTLGDYEGEAGLTLDFQQPRA